VWQLFKILVVNLVQKFREQLTQLPVWLLQNLASNRRSAKKIIDNGLDSDFDVNTPNAV